MIIADDGKLQPAITTAAPTDDALRLLHKTIKKVTGDINNFAFNTAISQMMIFVNEYLKLQQRSKQAMESFVLILAPFAPHIAEELWHRLDHRQSLTYHQWPRYDEQLTCDAEIDLVIQINGKVRDKLTVPADCDEETIKRKTHESTHVQKHLQGKTIKKIIVVRNRLINIVAG
jgi:leucyl-tRNA synthetase